MRYIRMFLAAMFLAAFAVGTCSIGLPEDAPAIAEAVADAPTGPSLAQLLWAFVNSPLGLTAVAGAVLFILSKVFLSKPQWKVLVEQYGPSFLAAVKYAEKQIPDDTPNKGLARLDEACKYLIKLQPHLASSGDKAAIKDAMTAVHAKAEAAENI